MTKTYPQELGYNQISKLLPYKAPWLLIDRVISWDQNTIIVQKAISGADPMNAAHLTNGPSIMPGVLLIEFIGQAAMLLSLFKADENVDGVPVLGRCKGEFKSSAYIGDLITGHLTLGEVIDNKTMYEGTVYSGDRVICNVSGIGALIKNH